MNKRYIGISAALISAASWAAGAILFKRVGESMSSLAMTLTKGAISLVLLGLALVLIEGRRRGDRAPFARLCALDRRAFWLLVGSGLLGIAVADTCFFEALKTLSAHSVVVLMMVGQIVTPVLAVIFLRERATLLRVVAIALVVAGVSMLGWMKPADGLPLSSSWRGAVFGLLSVFSMSASFIMAKKALVTLTALQGTFIRMLTGTLGILLLGLSAGRLGEWVLPLRDIWFAAFFLGSVCVVTFGGFWLSLAAFKYTDAIVANTLVSTEPLFVLVINVVCLHERVPLVALAASVVAVLGVYLLCVDGSRDAPAAEAPAAPARQPATTAAGDGGGG